MRALTFGTFSELQRLITGAVTGVQDVWSGYIALRGVNEKLFVEAPDVSPMRTALITSSSVAHTKSERGA